MAKLLVISIGVSIGVVGVALLATPASAPSTTKVEGQVIGDHCQFRDLGRQHFRG